MEVRFSCISCHGTGERVKAYDQKTKEYIRGTCECCEGTGKGVKTVPGDVPLYDEYLLGISCPSGHRCPDLVAILYSHRSSGQIRKGDIMISGIGPCYENTEECVGLRSRIDALPGEEWKLLLDAASRIQDVVNNVVTH